MAQHECRIGELARIVHMSAKTIRYYEDVGLLPRAKRNSSGYRLYSSVDLERLRFVRRSKLLGLSLRDLKELLEYAMDGHCRHLQRHLLELIRTRRAEIDLQVEELLSLKEDLNRLEVHVAASPALGDQQRQVNGFCSCLDASLEPSGAGGAYGQG